MKLKKDALIYNPSGEEIGNLNRFVMNPATKQITHIVFEQGLLDKEEYVVPFDWVDRVDERGIHLRFLPTGKDELLPFKEDDYIITDEENLLEQGDVSDKYLPSYYFYPPPPYGAGEMMRPNEMYVNQPPGNIKNEVTPGGPVYGEEPVIRKTERNIPEDTVGLKEGAKVMSSDSKHIGDVEQVILDKNAEKATHLVITKGLLLKSKKLVPADWVSQMLEDEVTLAVNEDFIRRLPDYEGK